MLNQPTLSRSSTPRDDSIDGRRYLAALQRSSSMIVGIVVVLTIAVLLISLVMSKTYSTDAQLIVPQSASLTTSDASSAQRYLATLQTLVTSPNVLRSAAPAAHAGTHALQDSVTATVDPNANLITVTATDGTADGAARKANAVTHAFLASQASIERRALTRAQGALTSQIRSLRAGPDAETQSTQTQITALNARLAELSVSLTNAGSDLQIARDAQVPAGATSPKPIRNAVLGLFVSIFIGILAALARDQLRPGITDQREVAELLDLPVLATIPEKTNHRSLRRAALAGRIEQEAYRTLSASLRLTLKPDREHILLTTSALHAEGKTSVTMRLGRLLAESGRRTLIVSADLRWPRLDSLLGLEGHSGFSDFLAGSGEDIEPSELRARIVRRERDADVLPAGTLLGDEAAPLLTSERLEPVMLKLCELGYVYILVDAPPLLGLGDTQILASHCDDLLVVSRVRGLHLDTLLDLRATLDRLPIRSLGVVVIGGHAISSPYYAARPNQSAGDDLAGVLTTGEFSRR
jgi:Mrp family chromosome partitioning ATPase